MAQNLGVARAVFISALLRSDPPAPDVSRDNATLFARTLLKTCNICTASNIKLCKSFIVKHVLPSTIRTAALVKYLVTLSKSFESREPETRVDTSKVTDENEGLGKIVNGKVQQPPEPAFKRLHVLYIVHDVLCYTKLHPSSIISVETLKSAVPLLSELATCGCTGKSERTRTYVLDLISYWERLGLFEKSEVEDLRENINSADHSDWTSTLAKLADEEESRLQQEKRRRTDETKWRVPERHGVIHDPSAPWHELPAANGLYMQRTYGYPLRASAFPTGGFRLRHGGAEADSDLKESVSKLHTEALRCFDKYTPADEVQDIDALGNIIWKDPERPTRNFWGFTLEGIEKRKQLARQFAETASGYSGMPYGSGRPFDPVDRARALASERGRGMGGGRGEYGHPRGGWRGGSRRGG